MSFSFALLLLLSPGWPGDSAEVPTVKLDPVLENLLTGESKVRVVVALRLDESLGMEDAIRQAADRVAQQSDPAEMLALARFKRVPAVIATVSAKGLSSLAESQSVAAIEWDQGGLGLKIGPQDVNKLERIAILDTGIGYDAELGAPDKLDSEACFCTLKSDGGCCPDGSREQTGAGSARDYLYFDTTSLAWIRPAVPPPAGVVTWKPAIRAVKVLSKKDRFETWEVIFRALDSMLDRDEMALNRVLFSFASHRLYEGENCGNSGTGVVLRQVFDAFWRQGVRPMVARAAGGPGPGIALPGCLANGDLAYESATERYVDMGSLEMQAPPAPGNAQGPPPAPVEKNRSLVFGVVESIDLLEDDKVPAVDTPADAKFWKLRIRVIQSSPLAADTSNLIPTGQMVDFATLDSVKELKPGQRVKFQASLTGFSGQGNFVATGFRLVSSSGQEQKPTARPQRKAPGKP